MMSFFIEAQLIKDLNRSDTEKNKCNFNVTFSEYTEDDTKIERIISIGLNTFQKRNSNVHIEDGSIEFFEDNSVKLSIECSFTYALSEKELEHLRQELIAVFQPAENKQAAVPAVVPQSQPLTTPNLALELEEMKQDLEAAFVSSVNSNIKSFQNELRKELNAHLAGFRSEMTHEITSMLADIKNETEKNSSIISDDLLMSHETSVELIQTELRQIVQRDKGNYSKLKKKIDNLETILVSKESQNEQLKQSMIDTYLEIAAENEEKTAFLRDQLSSEIEENNVILSGELLEIEKKLNDQLAGETREIKKWIQQVNLLVTEANDSTSDSIDASDLEEHFSALTRLIKEREGQSSAILTTIQEHNIHLEERIDEVNKMSVKVDQLEMIVSKVVSDYQQESQKMSELVEKLLNRADHEMNVTASQTETVGNSKEEFSSLVTDVKSYHEELNNKMAVLEKSLTDVQDKMETVGSSISTYTEQSTKAAASIDKVLKEQKDELAAWLRSNQQPLEQVKEKKEVKPEAPKKVERRIEEVKEEVKKVEPKVETTEKEKPKTVQPKIVETNKEKTEPDKPEQLKTEPAKREEAKKIEAQAEKQSSEKVEEKKPELIKKDAVQKEKINVSVVENKPTVTAAESSSKEKPADKIEKSPEAAKPSALKTAVLNEINNSEKKRILKNLPKDNPFLDHYDKATDLFAESYTLQGANKLLKKNKSDYREAIMNANYIEYRWSSIEPDSYLFEKYKLKDFTREIQQLPDFLSQLNSESKKESRFNQNVIKIKNSVWQKLSGYLWLSIYLEKILTLEAPHD